MGAQLWSEHDAWLIDRFGVSWQVVPDGPRPHLRGDVGVA
jgi:predicted 3-demethylubiquinone-9 3-methyltransferase (glyoxalase superfamily)